MTGKYTLLVGDNTGDATGSYGLFLQRTNNAGNAEPIAFGETKTGSITKYAEMKNYTFNANAGDTIYTRMDSSWDSYPQIRLYAPNGATIATPTGTLGYYATDLTQILPLTGKYTLLVGDKTGDASGSYGLSLQYIGTTSTIAVTSPNGGEMWQRGTPHMINWSYTGSPGSLVKITLLKAGTEVGTIASSVSTGTGGKGSYIWAISSSGSTGSDYKVNVQSISQPAIQDSSNNTFTLTPPGMPTSTIAVTSPNGGEMWKRGTSHMINWSYTGSPGRW